MANQRGTFAKRQREMDLKDKARAKNERRAQKKNENPGTKGGFIWIRGHYEWRGNQYEWVAGHWERERARQRWNDGRWELRGGVYIWVPGGWQ